MYLRPRKTYCFAILFMLAACSGSAISSGDGYEFIGLPDGSEVYLNKNTRVSFDRDFEDRLVELDGEAYFVVVEAGSPFVVRTSLGEVEVTGTEFSVFADKSSMEVEVSEGAVVVDFNKVKKDIKRGQKAVVKFGEDMVAVGKAEFKFKKWMKEMEKEFKRLGRDIKKESKGFGKESKKAAKSLKKEMEKLK